MRRWTSDFHDFDGRVWLNCAHQGPLPKPAVDAAEKALELKKAPYKIDFGEFFELPERLRRSLAALIGSSADEIALGNSATFGIQILVHGIPWRAGDEVLVVAGDFPASVVTWRVLERRGVRIRLIEPAGPFLTPEDVKRHLSDRTRVLCATWVSSYTGWVIDPAAVGEVARERGVVVILNISQGLGNRPFDVAELPVDAITCCGFKWLLGPYGTGFAWLRPALLDQLERYQAYWLSMQDPSAHSPTLEYGLRKPPGARPFDVFGTANFLNFTTWLASVDYLLEQGLDAVIGHDRRLVSQLVGGLASTEFARISPSVEENPSAVVVFSHRDKRKNEAVHRLLGEKGYDISLRGGDLRVSPHLYNTEEQIDGFVETLRAI